MTNFNNDSTTKQNYGKPYFFFLFKITLGAISKQHHTCQDDINFSFTLFLGKRIRFLI